MPLIALAPEELSQLLLGRLLQNQPRAEAADRLDRVVLVADTGDEILKLAGQRSLGAMLAIRAYPPRRLTG